MRPAIWSSQGSLKLMPAVGHAKKLAHALDHDGFRGPHLEKTLQDRADREESHEHVEDEYQTLRNVHRQFSCWPEERQNGGMIVVGKASYNCIAW